MNGISNGSNGNQVGSSGSPINPLLGSLMNNGGPTFTHALLYNSPGVDAGNDCVFDNTCSPSLGSSLTTDQRGLTRKADGNADGTGIVDIGAYERQATESRNVASGTNVFVDLADVRLTFPSVSVASQDRTAPDIGINTVSKTASISVIPPSQYPTLGSPPPGYNVTGPGFDLTNSFGYTGEVDVCFYLPSITDPNVFANLAILHQVSGNLVDHGSTVSFAVSLHSDR